MQSQLTRQAIPFLPVLITGGLSYLTTQDPISNILISAGFILLTIAIVLSDDQYVKAVGIFFAGLIILSIGGLVSQQFILVALILVAYVLAEISLHNRFLQPQ